MKRFPVFFVILASLALTACDRFNPPAASPTIVVTPPADAAPAPPVVVQVPVAVPGPPGPQGPQGEQGDDGKRGRNGDTIVVVPAEKKSD
jgi:hypothetical protein